MTQTSTKFLPKKKFDVYELEKAVARFLAEKAEELRENPEKNEILNKMLEEINLDYFARLPPPMQFTTLLWEKKTHMANEFLDKIVNFDDFLADFSYQGPVIHKIVDGEQILCWITEPKFFDFKNEVDVYKLLFEACEQSPTFKNDNLSKLVQAYFLRLSKWPWEREERSRIIKGHPLLGNLL